MVDWGKQAHPCNAPRIIKDLPCRCRSDWTKEKALTGGDLTNHLFGYGEKSAEVIVVAGKRAAIR